MKNLHHSMHHVVLYSCMLIGLAACSQSAQKEQAQDEPFHNESWKTLNLREKIGQIVCLSYDRNMLESIDGDYEQFLAKYPVGSIFMSNWNITPHTSPDSIENYLRSEITKLSASSKHPLLFSEDFESGVGRTVPGYTPMTTAMGLGATNSEACALSYGTILGEELRSLGFNWILNPVVDMNMNSCNFITNVRSMGSDPSLVSKISTNQILGLQSNGVAATAKHFPGDGTDYINQHFATPQVKLSQEDWDQTFRVVFQNAINNGVMCIMPGHISFPAYQKHRHNGEYLPATLSEELMIGLLKTELNFKGVIVSDALNMAGIENYYENNFETQIECFKAGADILLWPNIEVIDTIEQRIIRGEIPESRLNDAVARIWNMKDKLGLHKKDYQAVQKLTKADLKANKQEARIISKASITMLSNKNNLIPLSPKSDKNILIVATGMKDFIETLSPMKQALEEAGHSVDLRYNLSIFSSRSEFETICDAYAKVIFVFNSRPGSPWGGLLLHDDAALTMWSANTLPYSKTISISLGDPHININYMPRVWTRMNAYNDDEITQQILVDMLCGKLIPTGVSPITSTYE